jgi:hypothetical protein
MRSLIRNIGFLFFCFLLCHACEKPKSYPPVPEIGYESYSVKDGRDTLDNKVRVLDVKISFADGDGDLFSSDTTKNLFLTFYKRINGVFTEIPSADFYPPPWFSLPYDASVMDKSNGQNKTQKGDIEFKYLFYYPLIADTIELDLYVKDMAGNKSNILKIPGRIALN